MQIIKRPKSPQEAHQEHISAMWALFLLQNSKPAPLDWSVLAG
jgi:hypothetical protein